jgi:AraC family transcriptional regulator
MHLSFIQHGGVSLCFRELALFGLVRANLRKKLENDQNPISTVNVRWLEEERRPRAMIARESIHNADREPGKRLASSLDAGWESLLVHKVESPALVESYETVPTQDQAVTVVLSGRSIIESASSGKWKAANHSPGSGGTSEPHHVDKLRWRTVLSSPLVTAHLYIPSFFLQEAREGLNLSTVAFPNHHGFVDPLTAHIVTAVADAFEKGYSDLYAETAARFLATHLLLSGSTQQFKAKTLGELPDARLERVLDFIDHHLDIHITIAMLSREAGISPFHFARLFRRQTGASPFEYITRLRMQRAAENLVATNQPVGEIANASGYEHAGHFATAFKRVYGETPIAFRKRNRAPLC